MNTKSAIKSNLLILAIGLFVAGFITGVVINSYTPGFADELHAQMVERFRAEFEGIEDAGRIFSKILVHNLSVCAIMTFAGIIFGLPPAFILFINGIPLGIVLARSEKPLWVFIGSILPHGMFELPATFLAGTFGLLLGCDATRLIWYWMKGEGEAPTRILLTDLRKVLICFVLVLILLTVAAVVETFLFLFYINS